MPEKPNSYGGRMSADPGRYDDVEGWHHRSCAAATSPVEICDCGGLRELFTLIAFEDILEGSGLE